MAKLWRRPALIMELLGKSQSPHGSLRGTWGALRAQDHLGSYSQVPMWVQSVQTSIQNLSSTLHTLIQPTVDNLG